MTLPNNKSCCVDCNREAEGVGAGYSAGCYDATCHCHTSHTGWEDEFEKRFVRDDGLMNKYTFDGTEDGFERPTAEAIKSFISTLLKEARQEEREEILNALEQEMLDKIYYIGDELPQTPDNRSKFVLLGYPAKFLEDVRALLKPLTTHKREEQTNV